MRFVTFQQAGNEPTAGVLLDHDSRVLPLDASSTAYDVDLSSVQAIIAGGEASLDRVREIVSSAGPSAGVPRDTVRLLAPLPRPEQIRDALCFLDHLRNAQRVGQ